MSTVVMRAVTSVDGYVADETDEVGPLFDWHFNGDQPIVDEPLEEQHAPFASRRTRWPTSGRSGTASARPSRGGTCAT